MKNKTLGLYASFIIFGYIIGIAILVVGVMKVPDFHFESSFHNIYYVLFFLSFLAIAVSNIVIGIISLTSLKEGRFPGIRIATSIVLIISGLHFLFVIPTTVLGIILLRKDKKDNIKIDKTTPMQVEK